MSFISGNKEYLLQLSLLQKHILIEHYSIERLRRALFSAFVTAYPGGFAVFDPFPSFFGFLSLAVFDVFKCIEEQWKGCSWLELRFKTVFNCIVFVLIYFWIGFSAVFILIIAKI